MRNFFRTKRTKFNTIKVHYCKDGVHYMDNCQSEAEVERLKNKYKAVLPTLSITGVTTDKVNEYLIKRNSEVSKKTPQRSQVTSFNFFSSIKTHNWVIKNNYLYLFNSENKAIKFYYKNKMVEKLEIVKFFPYNKKLEKALIKSNPDIKIKTKKVGRWYCGIVGKLSFSNGVPSVSLPKPKGFTSVIIEGWNITTKKVFSVESTLQRAVIEETVPKEMPKVKNVKKIEPDFEYLPEKMKIHTYRGINKSLEHKVSGKIDRQLKRKRENSLYRIDLSKALKTKSEK